MSIYKALNIDRPLMCYSALHQVREGTAVKDYAETMANFHQLLQEESAKVTAIWNDYIKNTVAGAVQTSRGSLSQFLTTPIQSDVNDIQRILEDQATHMSHQMVGEVRFGIIAASEGKIVWHSTTVTPLKKLLASGKRYLQDLQFNVRKGGTEIFESNFFIEGGVNFDLLEHIVRDRIGIYTPVHGKHIKEFDSYTYAAHNSVYQHGDLSPISAQYEAELFFSKGETKYAPFRSDLVEFLQEVHLAMEFEHVSLWQRKLGLGSGKEFVLRIRSDSPSSFKPLVEKIASEATRSPSIEALQGGHLLLKELVQALASTHEA